MSNFCARAKTTVRFYSAYPLSLFFILAACFLGGEPALAQYQVFSNLGGNEGTTTAPLCLATQGSLAGHFIGVASQEGGLGAGYVFKLTPNGTLSDLNSFTSGTTGFQPYGGVIQASDGNFYGTANAGGQYGYGTVYQITPAGVFTILHKFSQTGADGASPYGNLVVGADHNLYGTTDSGGSNGDGCIYKISLSGNYSTFYSFNNLTASDGEGPQAGLIVAHDGKFYGTTYTGGSGSGTVFSIDTNGNYAVVHTFQATSLTDGANPVSALVQGLDGALYGTTSSGGSHNAGTVFRIGSDGYSVLYNFGGFTGDGSGPAAALLAATDGTFYGTTQNGGAGFGNIFQIDSAGNYTVLHNFGDGNVANDGTSPVSSLIEDSSGNLYGTTPYGGSNSRGIVYKLPLNDPFGGVPVGGLNYSSWFGYYSSTQYPLVYEYNLGYEYAFPVNGGVYLFDYTSGHFWYTAGSYFPFVYDFTLNAYLYYYQATTPKRHFYDYGSNQVITE